MNKQIKRTWLLVLASNTYQASSNGYLVTEPTDSTSPTTYSALGVLCEIARAAGVDVGHIAKTDFALPPAVAAWAEIDALPWMLIAHPSGIYNLAHINAIGAGSFDLEISVIREHL
jgi:hypothetical protein